MKYNEYEEPITGSHKRRFAKVTLYLEVPSLKETEYGRVEFMSDDEIANMVEDCIVSNCSEIQPTSFPDIMLSDIEGDNPEDFDKPVGYLAPDGRFFLIESDENGLAHIHLSYRVYQLYSDLINGVFGTSLENKLEKAGFVKVHTLDVRYYSRMQYAGFYSDNDDEKRYTPRITEAQQESLLRYFDYIMEKEFPEYKYVSINNHLVERSKIKQMDNIQFNTLFYHDYRNN